MNPFPTLVFSEKTSHFGAVPTIHLGRLKPPRKAAGQMDLLTVTSGDGAVRRHEVQSDS